MTPSVSRLIPPPTPKEDLPRCDAVRSTRYLNDYLKRQRDPEWNRCAHGARFRIGKRNYCTRHASQVALRILLGEKTS